MSVVSQLLSSRWRWLALVLLSALICWPYVYCVLAIVYNYAFWVLFSSTVQIASPQTIPSSQAAHRYSNNSSTAASLQQQQQSQLIPKLLHQTWRDADVPEKWREAQASCRALHADYEYKLWSNADAEQLIAAKFPWFLTTYRRCGGGGGGGPGRVHVCSQSTRLGAAGAGGQRLSQAGNNAAKVSIPASGLPPLAGGDPGAFYGGRDGLHAATPPLFFLAPYRSYPYDIQRADAIRYFILYEFGGLYLDLDIR